MDINSLLSPQDSPATETPPPPSIASPSLLQSPSKRAIRQLPSRTPSGLSQQITSSPQPHAAYQQLPSPGITSHLSNGARPGHHSALSTPPIDRQSLGSPHDARMTPPHHLHRQASTPGMDTLADLASMQHQQQAVRQNSVGQRPSISLQNIPRTLSGASATDIAMAEPSPKPRVFSTKALDQQHIDYLIQLDKALSENPFDYYSHVSLVTILHQGMQNHISTIDSDAHSYELLPILRDAYRTMANKYPLGELLWHYRVNDEKQLARNIEERMGVLELYKQATQDEPYSAKLWGSYCEYVGTLISCSWENVALEQWSEEEKSIGRELFQPHLLLETLQQGADKVKYNLNDSSLVWDRYLEVLEDDLERGGFSQERAARVAAVFNERLGQPHASWATTLSKYASFNSRYNSGNYEDAMEQAVQKNTHIKQQYANREEFEFKLLQAIQHNDQDAEYHAMTRYLKWEKKTMGVYSFHLVNALYERATLRFPVDPAIWEDHIEFLIWQQDRSVDLPNVLERATRHCPWSGSLWSHRILTLEAENRTFEEIEGVKHTATGTGLLEHTDIEELIKVQIAWCGYLRRRAFDDPKATEDDADIAEVGIRSALEFVREVGMKKHGRDWPGDPKYRLDRIHIKFWLQRGNVDEARQIWDVLVKQQADSYDFWYRYYIWEMVLWANHAVRDNSNTGQHLQTPSRATAVLEQGMARLTTMDYPEPLVEMYVNHCEQHESVLKVRSATIERRRAERIVAIRREKERAEAEAASAQQGPQNNDVDVSTKRKREDMNDEQMGAKKSKHADAYEEPAPPAPTTEDHADNEPSEDKAATQKRDREHTSIIVKKLPADTTQTQIRKFFTDAGTVRNLVLKPEEDSLTAIVEFETAEEADYALSKEAKGFEGKPISIERGESTTLYVTNYPAHADEDYLRKLFSPFGEIIAIRFPSLKFDTHRRFCYIQFSSANEAVAATKLNATDADGLKLVVKVSDPKAKKKRDGATSEGREVYVWHINFRIKQREIEEAFARFGKIERVNFPTIKSTGNNRGFCFVVYENKESADAAVAEMNGKDYWGLDLRVEIASDKAETKPKYRSKIENTATPEPREGTPAKDNGPAPGIAPAPVSDRSIAFLNLPDTVNDTRIKPLVEPYGFKKITLEPQHGGAVVEFTTVEGAGKAEIALQGRDFEGRKLKIGRPKDLRKQKGEWKAGSSFIQPARVSRPAVRGGARGRGRVGIGHRPTIPRTAASTNGEAKSNADFRAMLLGKQKDGKTNEDQDAMKE